MRDRLLPVAREIGEKETLPRKFIRGAFDIAAGFIDQHVEQLMVACTCAVANNLPVCAGISEVNLLGANDHLTQHGVSQSPYTHPIQSTGNQPPAICTHG